MENAETTKSIVREKYGAIARQASGESSCCGSDCCSAVSTAAAVNESYQDKEGYLPEADLGLGCGIPTEGAGIQPGHTVIDLGSGAGNDAFVARVLVGETGRVIGIDMTEAMVDKAKANNRKLGYANVEFRLGEIEDLPLANAVGDVVISNCVLNLVPDKAKAYREVFRVLKPGGRFSISDVVLSGELPPELRQSVELYVGCVAGALPKEEYLEAAAAAGFVDVRILEERKLSIPDALIREHLEPGNAGNPDIGVLSLTVTGRKL